MSVPVLRGHAKAVMLPSARAASQDSSILRLTPNWWANSRAGMRVWVLQATTTRRLTSGVSRVFGMGVPRLSNSCHILLGSPSMIGSVGVAIRVSGTRCGMELGNDVTRIAVVWLVDTAVRGLAVCQTARYCQGLWQSWSLYLS